MREPIEAEVEVLRILNGEDVPGWCWGAAMATCCAALVKMGYACFGYDITDAGRAYLKKLDEAK